MGKAYLSPLRALALATTLSSLLFSPIVGLNLLETGLLLVFASNNRAPHEAHLVLALFMTTALLSTLKPLFRLDESLRYQVLSICIGHLVAALLRPRLSKPMPPLPADLPPPQRHSRGSNAWRQRSAAPTDTTTYAESTFFENIETGESTWEQPDDYMTEEERQREQDMARMVFDPSQPLGACLARVQDLELETRLEQLVLMIKYVGSPDEWWAALDAKLFFQADSALARASLALLASRLFAQTEPVRCLAFVSQALFESEADVRLLDLVATGLLETHGDDLTEAWLELAKVTLQARFEHVLVWRNDLFVQRLFELADVDLNAPKALMGLSWYASGGLASELEIVASQLSQELDLEGLVGMERFGGLGLVGRGDARLGVKSPNAVWDCAAANPAFADKLNRATLLYLSQLGGSSGDVTALDSVRMRPALRKQSSARRNSVFQHEVKDAVLWVQALRMLMVLLFHNDREPCLLQETDLALCLDVILLELRTAPNANWLGLLQCLLGVLAQSRFVRNVDKVEFARRSEVVQVLKSIDEGVRMPDVYKRIAREILVLMNE